MIRLGRPSDGNLVTKTLAGELPAFEELVRRYVVAVEGLAIANLRNRTDAEDAVQDTFLKAFNALDSLGDPQAFAAWLFSIARNTCNSMHRQRRPATEVTDTMATTTPDPARTELREAVRERLYKLDENHREILILHYYAGMKINDIARGLNLTNAAVKKRLQRAREALGTALIRELGDELAPETPRTDRVKAVMGAVLGSRPEWQMGAASAGAGAAAVTAGALATGAAKTATTAAGSSVLTYLVAGAAAIAVAGGAVWAVYETTTNGNQINQTVAQDADQNAAAPAESVVNSDENGVDATLASTANGDANVDGASGEEDAVIPGGGRIFGAVNYSNGMTAAGVQVILAGVEDRKGFRSETETDANGNFEFAGLIAGRYGAMAFTDGQFAAEAERVTKENRAIETTLQLQDAGTITGTIVSPDRKPVSGAKLAARMYLPPGTSRENGVSIPDYWADARPFETDADGGFEIPHMWLGSWVFRVSANNFAEMTTEPLAVDGVPVRLTMTEGATVRGRVLRADNGRPVRGLQLDFITRPTTDNEGRFVVENLGPGEYDFGLDGQPYVWGEEPKAVKITQADTVKEVELRVLPGAVVTGRIIDAETGKGIGEAEVNLQPLQPGRNEFTKTSANGSYRFQGLDDGGYMLDIVDREGYVRYYARHQDAGTDGYKTQVKLGETESLPDFAMAPAAAVVGVVLNQSDEPVGNALVSLRFQGESGYTQQERGASARAGDDGAFEIAKAPREGTVWVSAKHDGLASEEYGPFEMSAEGVTGLELVLTRELASIDGTLMNALHEPLANETFFFFDETRSGMQYETDPMGRFEIDELEPGTYTFQPQASLSRSRFEELPQVTVRDGQTQTDLQIVFGADGAIIAGTVTDAAGKPIQDARVSAFSPLTGSRGQGTSAADGSFRVLSLEPDTYTLRVFHSEYMSTDVADIATGEKNVAVKMEPRATVRGQVVRAGGGEPIRNFELAVLEGYMADRINEWFEANFDRHFDESGMFSIEDVDRGQRLLVVRADGFATTATPFTVESSADIEGVVVALEAEGRLNGTVVDGEGNPMAGVDILVGNLSASQLDNYFDPRYQQDPPQAVTDAEGRFTMGRLPVELTHVTAVQKDFPPVQQPITVAPGETSDVVIQLAPGGRVEGVVRFAGKPVEATVVTQYLGAASAGNRVEAQSESDGTFVIENAAPGEALVVATVQTGEQSSVMHHREAVIAASQTTYIELDVAGGSASLSGRVTIDGQAPANAMVAAIQQTANGQQQFIAQPKPDGTFRIEGLPAGSVLVRVGSYSSDPNVGVRSAYATLDLSAGAQVQHDFTLDGTAVIRGTVSGDAAGKHVMVMVGDRRQAIASAASIRTYFGTVITSGAVNPDGTYAIPNLQAGEYTLVVTELSPEPVFAPAQLVSVEEAATAEANLVAP